MWRLIVAETQRYAERCRQNLSQHSGMKAFIGMIILMGKLPQLPLYWSTKHPFISVGLSEVMQIWRYFHLCNLDHQVPRGQPGHDKLFKVRELLDLDLVSAQFDSQYNTHGELAIDKSYDKIQRKTRLISGASKCLSSLTLSVRM